MGRKTEKQECSPTPGTSCPVSQAHDAQNVLQGWQSTKLDTFFL